MGNPRVNVRAFVDEGNVSGYQMSIVALIFLVIAIDGIDVTAMAFAAPDIIKTWGIRKQDMAPVLSSVFFGLAGGALVAGPIADRIGRKTVLVASVLLFGSLTALAGLSSNLAMLFWLRMLAGVGLGAALPQAVTLVAEFVPSRRRSVVVTIVWSGYTVGATAVGFLAAWLIPAAGWRVALFAAGGIPILVGLLLWLCVPESAIFLATKGKRMSEIGRTLARIRPGARFASRTEFFALAEPGAKKGAIKLILSKRYLMTTLVLWSSYFFVVFVIYCLFNWMPVMAKEQGFSMANAAIVTSVFTMAGPVGSVLVGYFMDKVKPAIVLVVICLGAALLLWGMSITPGSFPILCAFAFAVGFCIHASSTGLNALSTRTYPTEAAATGISWMQGIGKFGGVSSAFAGGLMLSWGWNLSQILVSLAVPAVLAAAGLLALGLSRSAPKNAMELAESARRVAAG